MQSEARTSRHYQELVERMRIEHAHMVKAMQERHEHDKTTLRTEYDALIT